MEKEAKTLTEMIQKLREKQFIYDFEVVENMITCKELNETYLPEELIIDRVYRFEGDSNPDDMSVLYGITSKTGVKGILIDAYGTYSDPQIAEVVKQISVRELDENQV